jgi:hypothetical protein
LCIALVNCAYGQELFPVNEPASTIPKGIFGVRLGSHIHYSKVGHREMIRLMYGLTSKISLMLTTTSSNFHISQFPTDLNGYYKIYHNHNASQNFYPYSFEGIHLFTKWRFLNFDDKNKHLRFALYNEISYNRKIHLDAFPSLLGDNSGASIGIISTKLYKKLAVSLTSGITKFFPYSKLSKGENVRFQAGNSLDLNLSIGYLVFPKRYTGYKNLNINLYAELLNKFYSSSTITRNGYYINTDQFQYLRGGNLIYLCPAVQFIVNSKTRVDIVTQLPLYHKNNITQYSMLRINLQHYFF